MSAKSYVVFAESGEYSNYRACVVAAFDEQDMADEFAATLQKANDAYVKHRCVNDGCESLFTNPDTQIFVNRWWCCKCPDRPQPIDPTNEHKESRQYSVVETLKNPATEWL